MEEGARQAWGGQQVALDGTYQNEYVEHPYEQRDLWHGNWTIASQEDVCDCFVASHSVLSCLFLRYWQGVADNVRS